MFGCVQGLTRINLSYNQLHTLYGLEVAHTAASRHCLTLFGSPSGGTGSAFGGTVSPSGSTGSAFGGTVSSSGSTGSAFGGTVSSSGNTVSPSGGTGSLSLANPVVALAHRLVALSHRLVALAHRLVALAHRLVALAHCLLSLWWHWLTGSDFSGTQACRNLEEIDATGNNLTDFSGLNNHTQLKVLRLGKNKIQVESARFSES